MKYMVTFALILSFSTTHSAATQKRSRAHAKPQVEMDLCISKAHESLAVLGTEGSEGTSVISAPRRFTPEEVEISRKRSIEKILRAVGKEPQK